MGYRIIRETVRFRLLLVLCILKEIVTVQHRTKHLLFCL